MPGIDSNTKLMLHCNGNDGDTVFLDSSPSGHTINVTATVEVDTAQSKFGGAAALFDGDSGCFSIDDSADWDIFGSALDDWTIDFWVRHTDHAGIEHYFQVYEGAAERWCFRHDHGDGLMVRVRTGGAFVLNTGYGGEIVDSNLHHIALCKVADKYGIYKGGTQVCYVQDDSTATFAAALGIGAYNVGAPALLFDGHKDEIRIQHSNIFGAAPNDTPDDTIVVPTREYSYGDAVFTGANF